MNMQKADPRITQLIQASVRRVPSVQPSVPKIAASSTTLRTLSAPVAPTAIGRLSSVTRANPLLSSYAKTFKLLPESSQMAQLIRASVKRAPSAHPTTPAGSSGFTPIPSALAAPLGGGGFATPSSGGLGGIGSSIVDTAKSYIPLAIKIVLAVIVFKIVLWLIRGRRR
jgi:hypothetical protein